MPSATEAGSPTSAASRSRSCGAGTATTSSRAPLDPRLLRQVRAARGHVLRTTALGLLQAACVIATALSLAAMGAALLTEHRAPWTQPLWLTVLVVALAVRACAILVDRSTAHRAATAAISELRARLLAHAARLGPRAGAGRGADAAALATTGLEKLRPYLVGYVPQLLLSATVTPLCLITIALLDPLSAVIAVVTLPLIPLFMILIGRLTVGRSQRLLADMRTLWSQLLDLVEGLPTLRALGRERGPERTVQRLGERHHASTMGSLRYAFLSSMVLELLATLCVALVAVSIGLRLVYGEMELAPALAILVLAPEAYLPLRSVGSQYHASTDGLAAVEGAFAVLEEEALPDGEVDAPDLRRSCLHLDDVSVDSRGGRAPHRTRLTVRPGRVTALTGASGAGKTTAVHVLLGLLAPTEGAARIEADGSSWDVQQLRRRSLWDQLAYLPQRPVLPPGTLGEVLAAAAPDADEQEITRAAAATGLDAVIARRGMHAPVGRGGQGLSLGERQRLALTRVLLAPAPLIVLDEPTAHLDGASEQVVVDLIRRLRAAGSTVLLIAHRSALVDVADVVVEIEREIEKEIEGDEAA